MTSSIHQLGLGLVLACLTSSCSLEPEPLTETQRVLGGQLVRLQGQRVPADDVYWIFSSRPLNAIINFTTVTWETAEFVPRVPGTYVVDRWAVSGPAGVWTDSFTIDVMGNPPGLEISGPSQIAVGVGTEYQPRLLDPDAELPGLSFQWTLSSWADPESPIVELEVAVDGSAVLTPAVQGNYRLDCVGTYDLGFTATATLGIRAE